jgi:hypothetical protein
MTETIIVNTAFLVNMPVTLFGRDFAGNIASYAVQDQIAKVSPSTDTAVIPGPLVPDGFPLDWNIKARVLTMYMAAASVPKFYKLWGDESYETIGNGGGTIFLIQEKVGGTIEVIDSGN